MKSLLIFPLVLIMTHAASAATVFTDTWFNYGGFASSPSLGPNGVASMHYGFIPALQPWNQVGIVTWSSSSSTTYTSFGADLRILTGPTSLLPAQSYPGAPLDPAFLGRVWTGFTDTWTLITPEPEGTRGTMRLTFQLAGTTTLGNSTAGTFGRVNLHATAGTIDTVSASVNGPGIYTLDMPIFTGTPQAVSVFLELRGMTLGWDQMVDLNYGHTAVLTGLSFTADGNTSPSAMTLNTESGAPGFTALTGGSDVPEPATVALSALGMAMVLLRRRAR